MLTIKTVLKLWSYLLPKRRYQFFLILLLLLLSATFEALTLFSILEVLEILSVNNLDKLVDSNFWDFYSSMNFNFIGFKLFSLLSFLILISTSTVLKILSVFYSSRFASLIGKDMSKLTFDTTIRLPYKNQINLNKPHFISILTDKLTQIVSMIMALLTILLNLLFAFFIILSIAFINFKITFTLITLLSLVYFAIVFKVKAQLSNVGSILSLNASKRIEAVTETLLNIKDVIIGQRYNYFNKKFGFSSKKIFEKKAEGELLRNIPKPIVESTGIILIAAVGYYFSEIDDFNSENILPLLATFAVGFQRLLPNLQSIYSSWTRISVAKASVISVLKVLDKYNKKDDINNSKLEVPEIELQKWNLEFKNVFFKYESNVSNTLSNVNFTIRSGERIGIIGESGSGKSTLVDLLGGLLQPTEGEVVLNGFNIHDKEKSEYLLTWWSNLSLVPQETFLSNSSIYKNINPLSDDKDKDLINQDSYVWDILKSVGLFKFVDKLPKKLETLVGANGSLLSGGQKQRIVIAKALYKKSKIIIFDESTSSLDFKNEKLFLETISKLDKNLTIIMISHKYSSLSFCNRIFKIDSKNINEISRTDFKNNF